MTSRAGDLTIDVTTNTAQVQVGFDQMARAIDARMRDVQRSVDDVNDRIRFFGDALKTITGIASVGAGIHLFTDMVKDTIEAEAHLQDVADKIGTTASEISKLIPAARLSGTSIDDIAHVSQKFSKSLVEMQDGTSKAAKAFSALGFSAQDMTRFLRDPTQGLVELSKRMQEFANDGNRTAAALELVSAHGKHSFADLLPFMKQLSEQQTLFVTVTDQQAQAAKRLQDQFAELQLRTESLQRVLANALVPELSRLVSLWSEQTAQAGGFADKVKELADDKSFAIWLVEIARTAAVVVESLVVLGKAAIAFAGSVQVVANDIRLATLAARAATGDITAAAELKGVLDQRAKDLEDANRRWSSLWNDNHAAVSGALTKELADLDAFRDAARKRIIEAQNATRDAAANAGERFLRGSSLAGYVAKPSIDTSGIAGGAPKVDEVTRALERLVRQQQGAVAAAQKLTEIQKVEQAIRDLGVTKLSAENQARASLARSLALTADAYVLVNKAAQESAQLSQTLERGYAQYAQSAAQVAKVLAESIARAQLTGISISLDELDREYARGVGDFRDYWDRKLALQRDALNVQKQMLQEEVDGANRAADAARTYLDSINTTNFANDADREKARADAREKFNRATAAATEAQSKLNEASAKGTQIGSDYVQVWIQANSVIAESARNLQERVAAQEFENDVIGLTAAQIQFVIASRLEEQLEIERTIPGHEQLVQELENEIAARQRLGESIAKGDVLRQQFDVVKGAITDVGNLATRFLDDFEQHGTKAFRNLGQELRSSILGAINKIAGQTITLQIAQSFGFGNVAQQALPFALGGGSGGAGNVLNGIGSLANAFTTGSSAISAAFATGAGNIAGILGAGTETALSIAGIAGTIGAAIPYVGAALAIGSALGLFNHEPSKVKGQFGVSSGTAGFEDNAFTASRFGNLGFLDANTQQFSGEAAQAFNKIIAGALDAFQQRFSADQSARLASILQNTTFASAEGTFTTQDFLQKYGGQVLQQVVVAAFDVLDPALGSVAAKFTGTADEIAAFGNTLLGVYDASKTFADDFRATIVDALGDATQETATNVLAFVQILSGVGSTIAGLGDALRSLDATQISAFVEAIGGVQAALAAFGYISQNFTTTQQRVDAAQERLNNTFAEFGLELPKTHAEFVRLLDAEIAIGNTDAVRAILGVADAFVLVHGTADDVANAADGAAGSLGDLANELERMQANVHEAMRGLMTDAQRVEDDWRTIHEFWTEQGSSIFQLTGGAFTSIPTTNGGVLALLDTLSQAGDAGLALADAIVRYVLPSINDLNSTLGRTAAEAAAAAQQLNSIDVGSILGGGKSLADQILQQIEGLLGGAGGDFAAKLTLKTQLLQQQITQAINARESAPWYVDTRALDVAINRLTQTNATAVAELAEFTTLSAQYGPALAEQLIGLEEWRNAQAHALRGNAAALGALNTIFAQRWQEIINGISTGVDGTLDQLDKLRAGLVDKFSTDSQKIAAATITLVSGFAKLGAAVPTSHAEFLSLINGIDLTTTAGQTLFSALEPLADAFLTVHGTAQQAADAVERTAQQMANMRQGLLDYVQGLRVGDTSILAPRDRFAEAQATFRTDVGLARGGDVDALGRLTKEADTYYMLARDVFASSKPTIDAFREITTDLSELGTAPRVAVDPSFAVANAMPTDSTVASKADIQRLEKTVAELLERIADETGATATHTAATADATQNVHAATETLTRATRDAARSGSRK